MPGSFSYLDCCFSFRRKHVFLLFDFYYLGVGQFSVKKNEIFDFLYPNVFCRISYYYKNKDVCKTLELKILNFGQMADIFVLTKISEIFSKILFLGLFQSRSPGLIGLNWF